MANSYPKTKGTGPKAKLPKAKDTSGAKKTTGSKSVGRGRRGM